MHCRPQHRPSIESPRLLKLSEAADSATCEVDTSQNPSRLLIKDTPRFGSLLNITTDLKILLEAT